MTCPVCGKEMKSEGQVKVQPTQAGGLLDTMFHLSPAEYGEKWVCEGCDHIELKKEDK